MTYEEPGHVGDSQPSVIGFLMLACLTAYAIFCLAGVFGTSNLESQVGNATVGELFTSLTAPFWIIYRGRIPAGVVTVVIFFWVVCSLYLSEIVWNPEYSVIHISDLVDFVIHHAYAHFCGLKSSITSLAMSVPGIVYVTIYLRRSRRTSPGLWIR